MGDKYEGTPSDYKDVDVFESTLEKDSDELQLNRLGYNQDLHRSWNYIENFAASFVSMNSTNNTRAFIFIGLLAGGPAAIWSSYIISIIFMVIAAIVLAEICSALPISGSIYLWAAASAGPKYARFFGFLVAWWASAGWMVFLGTGSQLNANYVASQLALWDISFPGGAHMSNIKWRAFIWAMSEVFLALAVAINYLPPRVYSWVFKFGIILSFVDFLLCVIWLPIGVSKTYGFRSAREVFTTSYNGTGAPAGWNWLLCFLYTGTSMAGVDASGHVAEETRHANIAAARGVLTSALLTGGMGFLLTLLFLFCTPDLDTLFSLSTPQPFVQIYAMALGKGPSIFMTIIAMIGLILCTSTMMVVASRLIFAVARDGVLPFSSWISKVDNKKQPRNAVTVMYLFAALIICTILPSQVAFTSLISTGSVFITSSYGVIALLRLFMTPDDFKWSRFRLGPFAKSLYVSAAFFCAIMFAVQVSPFYFPVTFATFNFTGIVFGGITVCAVLSWWFVPEDRWLPKEQVMKVFNAGGEEPVA